MFGIDLGVQNFRFRKNCSNIEKDMVHNIDAKRRRKRWQNGRCRRRQQWEKERKIKRKEERDEQLVYGKFELKAEK